MLRFTIYPGQIVGVFYSSLVHIFLFPQIADINVVSHTLGGTIIWYILSVLFLHTVSSFTLIKTKRYIQTFVLTLVVCQLLLQTLSVSLLGVSLLLVTIAINLVLNMLGSFVYHWITHKKIIPKKFLSSFPSTQDARLVTFVLINALVTSTLALVSPLAALLLFMALIVVFEMHLNKRIIKVIFLVASWPVLMFIAPIVAPHMFPIPAPLIGSVILDPILFIITRITNTYFLQFKPNIIVSLGQNLLPVISSAWIYFFMTFIVYQV